MLNISKKNISQSNKRLNIQARERINIKLGGLKTGTLKGASQHVSKNFLVFYQRDSNPGFIRVGGFYRLREDFPPGESQLWDHMKIKYVENDWHL